MKKLFYYYFGAIIVFLPLSGLAQALLEANTGLSSSAIFWISHWYELLLMPLVLYAFANKVRQRKCPVCRLFKPAWVFVLWALVSALFWAGGVSMGLVGFRYTALAVVFLLLAETSQVSDQDREKLISTYSIMGAIVAIWAIIERFLPYNYWQALNLHDFGWGKYEIIQTFYQSASFLNGPNQLASYLLPLFFINLHRVVKMLNAYPIIDSKGMSDGQEAMVAPKHYGTIIGNLLLILLNLAAIILTFSRSALIALVAALLIYALASRIKKTIKIGAVASAITALILGLILFSNSSSQLRDLFTHGASQQEHQSAYQVAFAELGNRWHHDFEQFMIGGGIGSAGPAVFKNGNGLIPESWYLQLWLELGLIGLLLWLWLIVSLIVALEKDARRGGSFALIAVSITALFLHSWADNPAMAISLFILVGLQRLCREEGYCSVPELPAKKSKKYASS